MKIYNVILLHVFILLVTTMSFSHVEKGTTNLDISSILDITQPVIEFHH